MVLGIPFEFLILGVTLMGVALFHDHPLTIALGGLTALVLFKWSKGFDFYPHLHSEVGLIGNLFGLLLGFSVLARHFEASRLPDFMPRCLPDGWTGAFGLLILVFILSGFLDNIAAALIGGTVAYTVFQGRVHVGYLVALTAASNAGGAGSVIGDTTTTMLWISGVPAGKVLHAYIGSGVALMLFGIPAALQQHRHQSILHNPFPGLRIEWKRIVLCGLILFAAAAANIWIGFPALGVWVVLLFSLPIIPLPWKILPTAARGATFLSALVLSASLMPIESLPPASWGSTLALGFISAFFDNIPLTRLAIEQGHYDWGMLAYAVGFGGSMLWFGSSAGVALSGRFPEARFTGKWLRHGWHVAIAYPLGFAALLLLAGWNP